MVSWKLSWWFPGVGGKSLFTFTGSETKLRITTTLDEGDVETQILRLPLSYIILIIIAPLEENSIDSEIVLQ